MLRAVSRAGGASSIAKISSRPSTAKSVPSVWSRPFTYTSNGASTSGGRSTREPFTRAAYLPLDQLPHFGLHAAVAVSDLCEERDGELQVLHRLRLAPLAMEEVGEIVVEGRLAMAVALLGAELERPGRVLDGGVRLAGSPACEREVVQRGDEHASVGERLGQLDAAFEMAARPGQHAEDVARLCDGLRVAVRLAQLERPAGELLRGLAVAPAVRRQAAVGLDPRRLASEPERLKQMPLGELRIPAPVVHPAELVLDARDGIRLAERGRRLVGRERRGVLAPERVQVADRLVEERRLRVPEADRRPVGLERLPVGVDAAGPVSRAPERVGGVGLEPGRQEVAGDERRVGM